MEKWVKGINAVVLVYSMDSKNSLVQLISIVKEFVQISKKPLKEFSTIIVGKKKKALDFTLQTFLTLLLKQIKVIFNREKD